MDQRTWETIAHTAIAGVERQPLPAAVVNQLNLPASDDPVDTALLALATAGLLRKSASPIPLAPSDLSIACPTDSRPLCRPAAVQDVQGMLRGVFPELLPEFFHLLAQSGQCLPPEILPPVLDYFARQQQLPEPVRAAMGPAAAWLARQHPDWAPLFEQLENGDWNTGSFEQRLRLLKAARRARPLVAMAWLEKTWTSERPEHKIRFLEALRKGLSLADEPLLERAAADKKREVRFLALRLLMLLPESRLRLSATNLWQQKTPAKAGKMADLVEKALPSDGVFSPVQLVALDTGSGTKAAVHSLLRLIPPGALGDWTGLAPDRCLQALETPDSLLEAFLDGIAWHENLDWAIAALQYFEAAPDHPLWSSEALKHIFAVLPEQIWQQAVTRLSRQEGLLDRPDSALVHTLDEMPYTWPKALLHAVLSFPARGEKPRHWQPPAYLVNLLRRAALRCNSADAESIDMPDGNLPYAWHSQLMTFRATAAFRRRIWEHLKA